MNSELSHQAKALPRKYTKKIKAPPVEHAVADIAEFADCEHEPAGVAQQPDGHELAKQQAVKLTQRETSSKTPFSDTQPITSEAPLIFTKRDIPGQAMLAWRDPATCKKHQVIMVTAMMSPNYLKIVKTMKVKILAMKTFTLAGLKSMRTQMVSDDWDGKMTYLDDDAA